MNDELAYLTDDGEVFRRITRHGDKWLAEDLWDRIPREEMLARFRSGERNRSDPDEGMTFYTSGRGRSPRSSSSGDAGEPER